jgi:glycosyltransferase involved in cell wall biosynthesis
MNVLHIHQDYPDGRPYPYTKAVSNLIDACQQLNSKDTHTVVSINRTSNPFKVSVNEFDQGLSFVYWAIPLPFIYYFSMKLSAYFIFRKIKNIKLDLIHGHKLTCEGVLVYFLSLKMNKPYVISIRGGSDSHNLSRLSQHIPFFEKIYKNAAQVFWVSAWAKGVFSSKLNLDEELIDQSQPLPNICDISLTNSITPHIERSNFITAISFHQYKRKGIIKIIHAISQLKSEGKMIFLDVYGTGEQQYLDIIKHEIESNDVIELVSLKGQVTQQTILEKMKHSRGFLMPSTNETFGMSYVEALSVCCPILYVKNTGIDGHLEDVLVGIKIELQTVIAIKAAIVELENNASKYQEALAELNEKQYLRKFTSGYVAENYLNDISVRINSTTR